MGGGWSNNWENLAWLLDQCSKQHLPKDILIERYITRFESAQKTARRLVDAYVAAEFLEWEGHLLRPSAVSKHWLHVHSDAIVLALLHSRVRFVGELLDALKDGPRTSHELRRIAQSSYQLQWNSKTQVNRRLGWLQSARAVELIPQYRYRLTNTGRELLSKLQLYRPKRASELKHEPQNLVSEVGSDDLAAGRKPKADREGHEASETADVEKPCLMGHEAPDIAARLREYALDGASHKELEVAVRDAFSFLGLEARQLSGAGQTDVLVRGVGSVGVSGHVDSASSGFVAVVEVKAVGNGRLTSNQVDLMTIKKHRSQHGADYALIVGPGPAGQLLDYAWAENIGVLDSARLAEIVRAQDEIPLTAREYQRLFADAEGGPAGGEVDLQPLEEARKKHRRLRDLLRGVFRAVSEIDDNNAGTAIPEVVQFALTGQGLSASLAEVESALQLLATPWFDALDLVDEGSHRYVPTITPHQIAQRLRWLADALDEFDGATATSSESG
ncbi:MAG: hypothetical protein OXF61_06960 [Acidimicrobiaceae bacterium]|nr:hypothetical protein [Acidimicrobiaceae bacterium]